MTNPVDFMSNLDAERDRLRRDLKLCQQRFDEEKRQHDRDRAERTREIAEYQMHFSRLRAKLREVMQIIEDMK